MKKFLKIILINLLICIFLLCIGEICCAYVFYSRYDSTGYPFYTHIKNVCLSYKDTDFFKDYEFRNPSEQIPKSDKLPIALMGCSFTYGMGLNETETLSARLADITGRKVYNAGLIASSPREILYILRSPIYRTKLLGENNNLEYIIYPYIYHHLFRLYNETRILTYSPKFKKKENSLEFYKTKSFISRTQLYKRIVEIKYNIIDGKKSFELMKLYLKEINREILKYYPNTQFVVLVYDESGCEDWNLIKNEGIKVLNIKDIVGEYVLYGEYRLNDGHPSAKAWIEIAPRLSEALKL